MAIAVLYNRGIIRYCTLYRTSIQLEEYTVSSKPAFIPVNYIQVGPPGHFTHVSITTPVVSALKNYYCVDRAF
jgi:hypothetical protein